MRILVLSDLHLEFAQINIPAVKADVIVLAGDIWKYDQGISWARGTWPDHEIVMVAGNHEFYGRNRLAMLSQLRITAKDCGVHFLENDEVIIDGVRFLGASMWTDMKLFNNQQQAIVEASRGLSDFRVIHEGDRHFSPADSIRLHEESKAWLTQKLLNEPFSGPTVVVTHHAPSMRSVAPQYKDDPICPCFASNLDNLFGYSKLWIHGHVHDSFDYTVKGTRVIANPRGYVRYNGIENWHFEDALVVTI